MEARWFSGQTAARIAEAVEGAVHDFEANTLTFGCRAGPSMGPEMLAHEMAHFVELPDDRIIKRNWGFSYGTPNISAFGIDTLPNSWGATKREIRTWSWQSLLLDAVGVNVSIKSLVSSAPFMNDFFLVPGENEKEKLGLIARMVELGKRDLTMSGFDERWFERISKLPELFAAARARDARVASAMNGDIVKSWSVTRKDEDELEIVINERSDGVSSCYEVFGRIHGNLCFDGTADFEVRGDALRYAAQMFGGDEIVVKDAPTDPRLTAGFTL
jgi:sulfur carrier protein ThiS